MRGWLGVLLPAGMLLAAALLPLTAQAGTTVTLFKSYAGNLNFVTVGNTLRANDNNTDACSLQSGLTGTNVNAGTSSATVAAAGGGGVPAGSTVVAAYLFYAGSGSTTDTTVTLNGTSVTADQTWTDTTVVPFFGGEKDVTSLIPANPDTTYTFTGLAVSNTNTWCSNQTVLAGWALVIIYSNPSEANRVINIYDGFQLFQNNSITLTPANFQVPSPPVAGSKFAVITWEGDPTLSGNETLQFNGNTLTDTCNGTNNQYNSTINFQGTVGIDTCTGNAATDDSYYGVDLDTFSVDGMLTAGDTSATTFYQSGQDAVLLTAQIISLTNVPVSDLSISKSHSGTPAYGANASWTLAVSNSGPATTAGTTKVTDVLPTGVTYVSASGTGWSCAAAGQTVTCTSTSAIASGASFPNITLTAFIGASTVSPLANTATVSSTGGNFDNNSGNNSSTDSVALVAPDLSTSTKTVFNTGGGDAVVGSTLQYTITLSESAGAPANGVSVSDDIPANLSGFTPASVAVTGSSTVITNSSTAAGGANGDGRLIISNITVPANGSVTIVFTAQVAVGTANCTNINNTATVTNPYGNGATPSSNAVTVAQSSCSASGSKVLYVYDNTTAGFHAALSRIPQPANTGTAITLNQNTTQDFTLTPVLAKNLQFANTPDVGNVTMTVRLIETASGGSAGTNRPTTVELRTGAGVSIATSASVNVANGAAMYTYTITVPQDTVVASGGTLVLRLHNNSANHAIQFSQKTAGLGGSSASFNTSTVINVDTVTAYTTNYSTETLPANGVFLPGQTVFVCAEVSDPFGNADTDPITGGTAPIITLTAPDGSTPVSGASMTKNGATNCAGTASTSTEAFEYSYPTSFGLPTGFWTATVTASEGTEGTVTDTANGTFDLDVPSLLVIKSVSAVTDPVELAVRPKAIPGATMLYTIQVQNNGRGSVDSGSMAIVDATPANTAFYASSATPYVFTAGTSGLTGVTATYSTNGGTTYGALPSCPSGPLPCQIPTITDVKFTFTGTMAGKTGATTPSFTITFQVVIQ